MNHRIKTAKQRLIVQRLAELAKERAEGKLNVKPIKDDDHPSYDNVKL